METKAAGGRRLQAGVGDPGDCWGSRGRSLMKREISTNLLLT